MDYLTARLPGSGTISIAICDKTGNIKGYAIRNNEVSKGEHTYSYDLAGLQKGYYYVKLFYNKEFVHYQELEVK